MIEYIVCAFLSSKWKGASDSNSLPHRNAKTYLPISTGKTSSKLTEPQWEQKWQYLFLTSVWQKLRPMSSTKALTYHSFGKDILTISFLYGTQTREAINNFTELANRFHPSIRFTAEISHTEIIFMETCLYKGDRLKKNSSLDLRTHFKPTETFQYTPFDSYHPPGVRKGFIKGEAIRLRRINS